MYMYAATLGIAIKFNSTRGVNCNSRLKISALRIQSLLTFLHIQITSDLIKFSTDPLKLCVSAHKRI